MKKYFSKFVFIAGLLLSCELPTEPNYSNREFFPLEIGNKWIYKISHSNVDTTLQIIEVVSQQRINEKSYYEFIVSYPEMNHNDTIYYRFNGDTLFHRTQYLGEKISADFSLGLNEYAYWDSKGDLRVTQRTDSLIVFERPFSADYGSATTYKRGVGLIKSEYNGFIYSVMELIDAEIN